MPLDDKRIAAEANRRYWESESSVAEVADDLGISRHALYAAIQPAPAGAMCPDCGAHLVYAGRSARAAGEAECAECGYEEDIDVARRAAAPPAPPREAEPQAETQRRAEPDHRRERPAERVREAGSAEAEQYYAAATRAPIDTAQALQRGRTVLLGGAALAGAAVGAVAAFIASRR